MLIFIALSDGLPHFFLLILSGIFFDVFPRTWNEGDWEKAAWTRLPSEHRELSPYSALESLFQRSC